MTTPRQDGYCICYGHMKHFRRQTRIDEKTDNRFYRKTSSLGQKVKCSSVFGDPVKTYYLQRVRHTPTDSLVHAYQQVRGGKKRTTRGIIVRVQVIFKW
jgi:hypothetical protein